MLECEQIIAHSWAGGPVRLRLAGVSPRTGSLLRRFYLVFILLRLALGLCTSGYYIVVLCSVLRSESAWQESEISLGSAVLNLMWP